MSTEPEILVIDDDPIMRDLVTDWLEAAGYVVRKATDCNSACAALERHPALPLGRGPGAGGRWVFTGAL